MDTPYSFYMVVSIDLIVHNFEEFETTEKITDHHDRNSIPAITYWNKNIKKILKKKY